jgi:hypothetical protein
VEVWVEMCSESGAHRGSLKLSANKQRQNRNLRWLSTAATPTAIVQRVCRRHRRCVRSVGRWSRHVLRSLALFPVSQPPSSPILSKDTRASSTPPHRVAVLYDLLARANDGVSSNSTSMMGSLVRRSTLHLASAYEGCRGARPIWKSINTPQGL